jgi:hypothetical protein
MSRLDDRGDPERWPDAYMPSLLILATVVVVIGILILGLMYDR